jgi:transcription-repair coupling factor (superfamily II helicase)
MPDVHQRLWFYKRLAQAGTVEELGEIRAEIIDRCGEAPDELDALCALMEVKVHLRSLRIRGLDWGPGRLVLALGPDAALDPFALAKKVQTSGGSLRLTPEMKLVARLEGAPPKGEARPDRGSPAAQAAEGLALLSAARSLLASLEACRKDAG